MKSKILIKWNWVGNKKWNGGKVLKGAFLSYNYWKYQGARFTPTKAEKLILPISYAGGTQENASFTSLTGAGQHLLTKPNE